MVYPQIFLCHRNEIQIHQDAPLAIHSPFLYYYKLIDKDLEAKNSLTDLGLSVFMVVSSAILIWGLSDKICTI